MPTDNYWKYSLFVDNIQSVYNMLKQISHNISEPFQFGDIGYLAHTVDSENHQIEYIQKTFKQKKVFTTDKPTALGLLTIRTKDPLKSIALFENILDLKLFVRIYVKRGNGFTLYFLGDKKLTPPNPDIDAKENREWMYQQSHLFIEIQYYWNSEYDDGFSLQATKNNGLQTINFSGNLLKLEKKLVLNNVSFHQEDDSITFKTSDEHTILVKKV